jgi:SSS family solute:Na+ symporter
MHLETLDFAVVAIYAVSLLLLAQWVSREKAGHQKDTQDYFLAGRALPWWAIGASLIAANISAEQIIGMSGSAFVLGIAIASYEWMAALTLVIVGKYLLPVFLQHKIYTMPQFLEQRYDHRVKIVMALFWLGVYVFVNLTSILWLGALAINTVTGVDLTYAIVLLAAFATAYSLYGGLKAVALTDIIQVVLLVFGGLLIAYFSMQEISGGQGVIRGFTTVLQQVPEKFDMIFTSDHPHYNLLPGISVLVGGMWIMNLSYWGFNQYIIQRALAAKDSREAQKGIVFAAFLKMLMPVLVVLPGIAAAILAPELETPDAAYPTVMKLLPAGLTGLVFAALIAAIVSSLASMMNSISTIFTMDIFSHLGGDGHSERQLVTVGRLTSLSAIVIATIVARPLRVPVHPGIHRFLYAGRRSAVPARILLPQDHGCGSARGRDQFGGDIHRIQAAVTGGAFHRSRRHRIRRVRADRHAGLGTAGGWRPPGCDRLRRSRHDDGGVVQYRVYRDRPDARSAVHRLVVMRPR